MSGLSALDPLFGVVQGLLEGGPGQAHRPVGHAEIGRGQNDIQQGHVKIGLGNHPALGNPDFVKIDFALVEVPLADFFKGFPPGNALPVQGQDTDAVSGKPPGGIYLQMQHGMGGNGAARNPGRLLAADDPFVAVQNGLHIPPHLSRGETFLSYGDHVRTVVRFGDGPAAPDAAVGAVAKRLDKGLDQFVIVGHAGAIKGKTDHGQKDRQTETSPAQFLENQVDLERAEP